jgi:hypothetical protein
MTSVAHAAPVIPRSATPGPRSLAVAGSRVVLRLCLGAVLAVLVLAIVVLAIANIDTGGRLPHPRPLPAPSAPAFGGS